jgi:hypothetical protein
MVIYGSMLKFLSKYSKNIKQTPHYEKGDIMGDVALVYKVAAEDQDNLENIEAEIKKMIVVNYNGLKENHLYLAWN